MRHTFSLFLASLLFLSQTGLAGELNFSVATASVAENGSTLVVTVQRSGTVNASASVTVKSVEGTAEPAADFNAASNVLSWNAGELDPKTVNITIRDDALVESDETFTLELQNVNGDTVGSTGTLTVTITDYEEGTLEFTADSFSASEEDGSVSVTIARRNGTDGAVGITLKSTDDSAKSPDDFSAVDTEISFIDGQDSANFTISLKNDEVGELAESFSLALSAVSGGALLGSETSATVEIVDEDADFTPTAKLIDMSTDMILQPEALDLKQPSIVDAGQTYVELINSIPVLTIGDLEIEQLSTGLIEIPLGDDKFYFKPVTIRRNLNSAKAGITLGADGSATFVTDNEVIIDAQPALAGIDVLQDGLTEVSLPEITVTSEGNLTIQMDQGPPPVETNSKGELVINNSFYNRWNFRPLSVATLSTETSEASGLLPHPTLANESLVFVIFKDGSDYRQQLLSPAPIDQDEFSSALRSRLGVVAVQFREYGIVDFSVVGGSFAGFSGATHLTLFADYMIRRVENFNAGMAGLQDAPDVNGDGVNDFKMVYANGEEQYFLTVEVATN